MRVSTALRVAAALTAPLWALSASAAAKDGPAMQASTFSYQPANLNYFEDSDIILFHDFSEGLIYRSSDAGAHWDKVTAIPAMEASLLVMHAYHPERAYVLTGGNKHYLTEDRGKTWQTFSTAVKPSLFQYDVLTFHATDPDRIIYNGIDYDASSFSEAAMYTVDGFRSTAKPLRGNTAGCWWAQGTIEFTTGAKDLDANRVLCIVRDVVSPFKQDQRLLISDNFFQALKSDGVVQEFEPDLDTNRPVQGIVNIAAVKKYLLVATTSLNTDEMALFVTDDTLRWHRAVFPANHRINQESYTVLESTNYSIQIDVMNTRPSDPTGVLFTSNSNGTFFTQNLDFTNRNERGNVDFEKISGIQGIFLVNRVENGEAVNNDRAGKKVVSEITFDDGRTFSPVTLAGGQKERLHLHSVTELSNSGRVFSSPAPGLVMAVGNTGDFLGKYKEGNLYISDDAGVSWIGGPKGPHKYEFGDQGSILLAVRDEADVTEVTYSLDHGKTWATAPLPDGIKIQPYILTTTQDSTSLKFVLIGAAADDKWNIISINFDGLHEATCKASDLEDWWARVDDKGQPTCLMGHTQKYHRRKKDAACFLKTEFLDPVVETTDCDCTDQDFECDYNFRRSESGTECLQAGPLAVPEGSKACGADAKPDDVFLGSSGWRLIPGNTCKRTSGKQKDDPVEHKCSETGNAPSAPATGEIKNTIYDFKLGDFNDFEKHYLERGDSSSDSTNNEAIIMRPISSGRGGPIFVTDDHGKTWTQPSVFDEVPVWAIIPHEHFKEVVFFVTYDSTRVIYTVDHGQQFHEFTVPYETDYDSERTPLVFHPDKKDWLIWIGKKCEDKSKPSTCFTTASFSRDRGDNWSTLLRYVERCEFIGSSAYKNRKAEEVLCLAHAKEESGGDSDGNPLELVASADWFDSKEVKETNIKGFATMAEFIVVAAEDKDKKSLRALASLDGATYAEAQFPVNFVVPNQHEYTVLDSSTHAVNLFVATETAKDRRFGTILKSNSNGTSYVMSIAGVNCDNRYYVDFEKILGLEGVLVVNVVANRDDGKATSKKLQTKISHNDGAEWAFLAPPVKDVDGKNYGCKARKGAREGGDEKCALHIHGYTEREDHRKTFSSSGAVGLMFGVGNVGDQLGSIADSSTDTFMTTDAGLTWRNVKKGAWSWQFGDQGSVVVLVPRNINTRTVAYTTDEGATWKDHEFLDKDVEVLDITTPRSGVSRSFLLWCRTPGSQTVFTINLDFSGLTDRACVVDNKDVTKSDYYQWSPAHPLMPDTQCLFGHVSQYLRKKTDRTCYNGYKIQHLSNTQNCTCSRRDYECDYNFELDNHGQCSLVPGLAPLSKDQWCSDHPDAVDYYPPTGFRRIPLTTCVGGDEFDKTTTPQPCKDHEGEFERKHSGPGAFAVFAIVLLCVGIAGAAFWYVYSNWSGKFGAIRLGEGGASRFTVNTEARYIKYPLIAIGGAVAVAASALAGVAVAVAESVRLPSLGTGLWRRATGFVDRQRGSGFGGSARRFTTRDSFARGRGDYGVIDDVEGELLGDDSDEEV
ncbi:vacuolar protein sorting/targeting protein PEP1 [Sporothrix epigloea]|uniref:Vacuolar protein sorting/targeting protein 10 n=1 Tax=Sporothrix epigloea TaxID=1892477 RepID=A0ABP0DIC7_9PEZI